MTLTRGGLIEQRVHRPDSIVPSSHQTRTAYRSSRSRPASHSDAEICHLIPAPSMPEPPLSPDCFRKTSTRPWSLGPVASVPDGVVREFMLVSWRPNIRSPEKEKRGESRIWGEVALTRALLARGSGRGGEVRYQADKHIRPSSKMPPATRGKRSGSGSCSGSHSRQFQQLFFGVSMAVPCFRLGEGRPGRGGHHRRRGTNLGSVDTSWTAPPRGPGTRGIGENIASRIYAVLPRVIRL